MTWPTSRRFYKHLAFLGVRLWTVAEAQIGELHVGFKGTMNALYLKDLAQKTHRDGRVRSGMSGGGICYGYDLVPGLGAMAEQRPQQRGAIAVWYGQLERKGGNLKPWAQDLLHQILKSDPTIADTDQRTGQGFSEHSWFVDAAVSPRLDAAGGARTRRWKPGTLRVSAAVSCRARSSRTSAPVQKLGHRRIQ